MLKQHLEDLVKEGHLKEYVEDTRAKKAQGNLDRKEKRSVAEEREPAGVIDVVHGVISPTEMTTQSIRTQRKMAAHLKEVYQTSTEPSIINKSAQGKGEISFSNEDLRDVVQSHNNALVLTLRVQEYDVRRMLIDPGASSEIIYAGLFDKLGLKQSDLRPTSIPLFGFSGQVVHPMGVITVQVSAGPIRLNTEFLVVDVPSPYNAIMGRTWIHRMRAVSSTYHQRIRFPTPKGIMEIRGDQIASRSCLIAEIKGKAAKVGDEGLCAGRKANQK